MLEGLHGCHPDDDNVDDNNVDGVDYEEDKDHKGDDDDDYAPFLWVEDQEVFYEVDPVLRDVREVWQVHCIIAGQCLVIMMIMVIMIMMILVIMIMVIKVIVMIMIMVRMIMLITFAIVRYLLPAQNGETPPETSMYAITPTPLKRKMKSES